MRVSCYLIILLKYPVVKMMKMNKKAEYPIDFVITWVDESDPVWRQDFEAHAKAEGRVIKDYKERYRDWGTLKYWFRGVEKFAPWVNKVYFVTYGHIPAWLNTGNPKLVIIKHEEFIPKVYLPTFNSYTIEFSFYRIKSLSEHFVYFNDDMFIINSVKPDRFFYKGLPCDMGAQYILPPTDDMITSAVFRAVGLINVNFKKRESVRCNLSKWYNLKYPNESLFNLLFAKASKFPHFKFNHLPLSLLKSTYQEVWSHCEEDLEQTCLTKFRTYGNVTHWLVRYWQLASGSFHPYNYNKDGRYFSLRDENIPSVVDCIRNQKVSLICLNDYPTDRFDENKNSVVGAFEEILPEKSNFEL